jgi:hypothetical protein
VFTTPIIDTGNNFTGINDFLTDNADTFSLRQRSVYDFSCSANTNILITTNHSTGKKRIKIKIPFGYDSTDIDLGLIADCVVDLKKDSLLSADCFIHGSLYPNGGQETNSHYSYQQNILSVTSSHALQWRAFNLPEKEYKKLLDPNFRINRESLKKKTEMFYSTGNSTGPLLLKSASNTSVLLATEFRLNFADKKASLKVWKNSKLILNENTTFTETIVQ